MNSINVVDPYDYNNHNSYPRTDDKMEDHFNWDYPAFNPS